MSKKIYDPIRKKEIVATPEEEVRQKVLQWMIQQLKVPQEQILVEYQIGASAHVDILVQSVVRGRLCNLLLIETKAPSVPMDGYVFAQAERYMQILEPYWVLMTNSKEFFFFKRTEKGYESVDQLPEYAEMKKTEGPE